MMHEFFLVTFLRLIIIALLNIDIAVKDTLYDEYFLVINKFLPTILFTGCEESPWSCKM